MVELTIAILSLGLLVMITVGILGVREAGVREGFGLVGVEVF